MAGSIFRGKINNIPRIIASFNPKSLSAPTIMIEGSPLPRGATINTLDGKKFIKTSSTQNEFTEISATPKPEWMWSTDGQSAWGTLSDVSGLGSASTFRSPTSISLTNSSILENNATGAVVGTLITADEEASDTFTYSIIGGDASAFTIVDNQLKAAIVFDYEDKSSYSITVRSTDSHGFYVEEVFGIVVNQVIVYLPEVPNDGYGDFTNTAYTGAGLKTVFDAAAKGLQSGKILLTVGSCRESYSYAYGYFYAYLTFNKNENNQYIFSYLYNGPVSGTKYTNENGTNAAVNGVYPSYPPIPNDFYINMTGAGLLQVFFSDYGVGADRFNAGIEVVAIDDLTTWEERSIPLAVDTSAVYSLTPDLYDNNLFEIVDQNRIKLKYLGNGTGFFNYENRNTYKIIVTKTKDSVITNEIKTIHVTDKNELIPFRFIAPQFQEYSPTYVWSTEPSLNVGVARLAAAGTQNAALSFGGTTQNESYTKKTESFNGTSWSSAPSLNVGRSFLGGCGTQTAALAIGGLVNTNPMTYSSALEMFNGSAWSSISASPAMSSVDSIACVGVYNNALVFGGYNNNGDRIAEKFNGNAWLSTGALLNNRRYLAGVGDSGAALAFGGSSSTAATEKFNGSAWTTSANMWGKRDQLAGAGTQNAAIGFGGKASDVSETTTILFDGTSWSATDALTTMRYNLAGCGSQYSALSVGGESYTSMVSGWGQTVEKFNNTTYSNSENPTFLGYLSMLADVDTNPAFLQNTYTVGASDFFEVKNGDELHAKPSRSKLNSKQVSISAVDINTGRTGQTYGYITVVSRPSIPDFSFKTSAGAVVSTFSIAGNQPAHTTVGWLWATDPDMWTSDLSAGYGSHFFAIVNGDTSNFYIWNASNAAMIMTSKPLAAGTYTLPIRVYDTSGLYKDKTLTIYVT